LKREIRTTGDGSVTIHIPEWKEHYHSVKGAVAEAQHVFLKMGLEHFTSTQNTQTVSILEIGFGTGLNAWLTFLETKTKPLSLNYVGVDAYPVTTSEVAQLNYPSLLNQDAADFLRMHQAEWELPATISDQFRLTKRKQLFADISDTNTFDLIYYDAFGSRVQPELWEEAIFATMFNALKEGGVLVTYAAKGSARRAMQAVGFPVARLPGPPGKTEMLRASQNQTNDNS
jgi:tRNA U34 5-methylaminomethyl-2-thiouridine-forming methyltransferase MnmC